MLFFARTVDTYVLPKCREIGVNQTGGRKTDDAVDDSDAVHDAHDEVDDDDVDDVDEDDYGYDVDDVDDETDVDGLVIFRP